ncbi:hypothetical protein [Fimbriiglobus ruber]|uniref:hypothetical protein n=1 Tax=Fimbriiglobus ruber TaxID=1908690 RepID=UPI00117AB4EF|nr:hypothetical protein [Fimbriiglobus ruber]
MASNARAVSAWRAVRRASWVAVPVMAVGFLGILAEATHAARVDGRGDLATGAMVAVVMSLFFLGLWLGYAAVVGWRREST